MSLISQAMITTCSSFAVRVILTSLVGIIGSCDVLCLAFQTHQFNQFGVVFLTCRNVHFLITDTLNGVINCVHCLELSAGRTVNLWQTL